MRAIARFMIAVEADRGFVKIFDRYILTSVTAAFFFGLSMFMVLLMAMSLFSELVKLIVREGVPAGTAFAIFAYQIPGMLVYAFPMSVLLSILLVFNRMSSDSEMVAIRASGVSFIRITLPTIVFSFAVAGMTFWISNVFAPFASGRADQLKRDAIQQVKSQSSVSYIREEEGEIVYAIIAGDLDLKHQQMHDVSLLIHRDNVPLLSIYAPLATWHSDLSRWQFTNARLTLLQQDGSGGAMLPTRPGSRLEIEAFTSLVKESPFDLDAAKKHPENFTTAQLKERIAHLTKIGGLEKDLGKWRMGLVQRYAVPFVCVIFALIGAPLGLRSHRASSAMGLGISLLIIFSFYSLSAYLNAFGEGGALPPFVAGFLPVVIGGILGVILLIRANR